MILSTNNSCNCNCGESCSQSCSESCSRSCNEACNESCSNCCSATCSNCCQQSCRCTSTSSEAQTLFVINSTVLFVNIAVGFINGFNSHTPIFLTLMGSILLEMSLTGFRGYYKKDSLNQYEKNSYHIFLGRFLFLHSHHCETDILKGKEFRFMDRYYCTGCYGLLFGTMISIGIFIVYLFWPNFFIFSEISIFFIPFFFLPIVLRYSIVKNMGSLYRVFSNAFLPIGCSVLFIIMDNFYASWLFNSLIVIFILLVAVLRGIISVRG